MKRMLFNATYQEELRVASVEGQKLINFDIETSSKEQRRGNIYKGVVTRVELSLEACFVDYGTGKQGFLPFKEIDNSYLPQASRFRDFAKLPEGTELIIQVEKDERGNKGAALTTYVSLPGRYLVLMPNNSRSGGISRRIDGEERDELKSVLSELQIPSGMSVIARTAALGRVYEELQWDLNYLLRLWDAIKNAWNNQKGSFLIYQESNLVIRSIRDHFSPDIAELLIDMEDIYEQARQFMSNVMPSYVNRVKLYRDDVPLFSRFQIEHQIDSAYSRSVNLPSGGSIVIDHTEALTSVDVNSAKANKGADIESTALSTNLEASEEIARQLRLRDLGGLVVVDFIDMENTRNQREVENFFKQQLGLDRARIQMGKLSKFGLLELSRQRLQASLEESTTISCPRCAGTGVIRGTESIAVHILRIIQEEAVKSGSYILAMHVQLPVEVATYLLNEKREDVDKIEKRMKIKVVLIPNVNFHSPNYKIRKITSDGYDGIVNKVSYNLVEQVEDTSQNYQVKDKKNTETNVAKAIVKQVSPVAPAPVIVESGSFMKAFTKFWNSFKSIFSSSNDKSLTKNKHKKHGESRVRSSYRSNPNNAKSVHTPTNSKTKVQSNSEPVQRVRSVGVSKSSTKVQTVKSSPLTTSIDTKAQVSSASLQANNGKSFLVASKNLETTKSPENKLDNNNLENNKLFKTGATEYSRAVENKYSDNKSTVKSEPKEFGQQSERKTSNNGVSRPFQPPVNLTNPDLNTKSFDSSEKVVVKQEINEARVSRSLDKTTINKTQDKSIIKDLSQERVINSDENKTLPTQVLLSHKNTILEPVDLGNLELVNTNPEEVSRFVDVALPENLNSKRYNDIIFTSPEIKLQDVDYQLVETKI